MAVPLFVLRDGRQRQQKERKLLEKISDSEIRTYTGLPWWALKEILPYFEDLEARRSDAIPLETKVIGFLSFLRSGTTQWMVGGNAGTSQPSTSRIIEAASNALIVKRREFIKFPTARNALAENKQGFHEIAGFPNIIGAIDGTQCAIKAPSQNEPAFVCRKGFHSINVQIVTNPKFEIIDIVAKWPGSTHDSFIWNNCGLKAYLGRTASSGWLIGIIGIITL